MGTIYTAMVAQQFASALLFFLVTWLIMRNKKGKTFEVSIIWVILGLLFTVFASGTVRFLAIWVVGGHAVLHPVGGMLIFFTMILPILVSIPVSFFLRTRAKPGADQ